MSVEQHLTTLVGEACWHVSAGGVTYPTFALILGDEVPRIVPLQNPSQPRSFRLNRGGFQLYVWSPWRLEAADEVLATSEQEESAALDVLRRLEGSTVVSATTTGPAWDLTIGFARGLVLRVFSTGATGTPFEGASWELTTPTHELTAGPGSRLVLE